MKARTRMISIAMAAIMLTSMSAVLVTAGSAGTNYGKAIDKLEPELRMQVIGSLGASSQTTFNTIVFVDGAADVSESGKAMERAGAIVKERFDSLGALSVDMTGKSALDIAKMGQVTRIFLDEYKYRLNDADMEKTVIAKGAATDVALDEDPEEIWWASTAEAMGAEAVWDHGVDGSGVLVAVLDTGCDITQTDLAPAVEASRSFTSEEFHDVDGHGTATAGLIASRGLNSYDFTDAYDVVMKMKGMAPGSKVMTGKVLDDTGYGWDSWIIGGIEWAVDYGADIISMSLGGMEVPNDGDDPTSLALDIATLEHGIVTFLSAGNEGTGQSTVGASGVSKTTITVGATTLNAECQLIKYWPLSNYDETELIVKEGPEGYQNDHMIWFSSRGPSADGRIDPDISAAGAWGPSTQPGDTLMIQFGGTSMAAPVAAGIGALIIQAYEDLNGMKPTPDEVKSIMMGTAKDMGYAPNEQGPGRVDALAAYNAVVAGWTGPGHASLALTIPTGESESVEFAEGASLGSRVLVPSETERIEFSEVSEKAKDWSYEFDVPAGDEYLEIDLAFDQSYIFKKSIFSLTKPVAYTDTHLNLVLYKLDDEGERTLVNYAYAHTNTQELNAYVTEGRYELRVSPVIYAGPSVPYDLSIEFYKTADWSWFSADGSVATISVPSDAMAGVHAAFIETEYCGVSSLVPVAVSVPIELEVPVVDAVDVGHEVWGYNEGDWRYFWLEVEDGCAPDALTAVLDWDSAGTDLDTYWINPEGRVVEASLTQYLGVGMFGPWETSTMETADVLTVVDPEPGMWMFALHVVLMDRVLEEPYTLTVYPYSAVEFSDESLMVKPGRPATVSVTNNVDQKVGVGLVAVRDNVVSAETVYEDEVSSIDQGGTGAIEILFDVAPLTESISLAIEWSDEEADIDVVIYAADWSNAGLLRESGESTTIDDPDVGEWAAIVTLKNSAVAVAFSLTLTTCAYEAWTGMSISADSIWLDPGASADVNLSLKGPMASAGGLIIAFDLMTGCEYDRLVITSKG